jgi:NhaP-type Na+/H+ or K+/H+ antiporter
MEHSDNVNRVLLAACALVWLAVIGVSVAAVVALVELGSGRAGDAPRDSGTPWGLYVVIGVSAAVILGSIPLLLRARRAALERPPAKRQPVVAPRRAPVEAPTEKLRVFGSVASPTEPSRPGDRRQPVGSLQAHGMSEEMVDQMWLRFTVSMATAIGVATLAVATATYFMGVKDDGSATVALVVAGIVTALMPLIPFRQLRQLRVQV